MESLRGGREWIERHMTIEEGMDIMEHLSGAVYQELDLELNDLVYRLDEPTPDKLNEAFFVPEDAVGGDELLNYIQDSDYNEN